MTSFGRALVVFSLLSCFHSLDVRLWVFAHFAFPPCLLVFALLLKGSTWGILPIQSAHRLGRGLSTLRPKSGQNNAESEGPACIGL